MDSAPRSAKAEIVLTDLMEGLGHAPDVSGDRIFMSDLKSLYTASLDGATFKMLLAVQGNLTGVAYVN